MSLFNRTSTMKSTKDHAFNLFFKDSIDTDVNLDKIPIENDEKDEENLRFTQRNSVVSTVSCRFYEIIHSHLSELGKNIITLEAILKLIFGIVDADEVEGKINSASKIEECIKVLKEKNKYSISKIEERKKLLTLLKKKLEKEKEFFCKTLKEKEVLVESFKQEEFNEIFNENFLKINSFIKIVEFVFFPRTRSENASFSCAESVCHESITTSIKEKIKKIDHAHFKSELLNVIFFFEDLNEIREKIEETRKFIDRKNENSIGKFVKLINLLVFSALASQKLDNSKENKRKIKIDIRQLIDQIKENDLKIGILQGILRKLSKNEISELTNSGDLSFSVQNLTEKEIKSILNELKDLKNTLQLGYNSYLRQIGKQLVKPFEI